MVVLKTVAEEYSTKATAHGVSYIFEKEERGWARSFWFFVVIASLIISGYMIWQVYYQWLTDPIVTTVKSTGETNTHFYHSSTSICHM